MRLLVVSMAIAGVAAVWGGETTGNVPGDALSPHAPEAYARPVVRSEIEPEDLTTVVRTYCQVCHNDALLTGNLTLSDFAVESAPEQPETAEKMIRKLRAGMMPPPGMPKPGGDTLSILVETLENLIDDAAAENPNPGSRSFQRLNRAEYQASVRDLLHLDIEGGDFLPLDTKSANFDNIADVQMLSPTMLDAYLRAADEISRLAVGMTDAPYNSVTYTSSGYATQWDHAPGAPRGTRGGISTIHNFPADGDYTFEMWFEHTTTGEFTGGVTPGEQIEISLDGERLALLEVDRWMHVADPNGMRFYTDPFHITAGPHRVSASFLRTADGPVEDILSPHDWSLSDRKIGSGGGYGVTVLAHLKDLVILGPENPSGVSETPSRRAIFTCRPTTSSEARPCAKEIVTGLATKAFRRPVSDADVESLLQFFDDQAPVEGFDMGIRVALQAILASPDFVFRVEETPEDVEPGETYRIPDFDLASRLSYFLWGTIPDDELVELARVGTLSDPDVFGEEVRRMLNDPRSDALGSRFAAQWLRLEDLEKVHPDRLLFPDFHKQLGDAMLIETELFFNYIVREDRSALDLFAADYTFVNERLARHYGIPGIVGEEFRRVSYPDDRRRGLFGHGSVLTLTSHANRTSPVLRGKWVMEVLLGTPPPPPPPGVPDLEQTEGFEDGRMLTTRERMERHRASPVCAACHQFMDPIGLALDNFDVTGKWRIRENSMPLDTRGTLYDQTPVSSPAELQEALLARPIPLLRNFTVNLMAYALGRRVEYYDMPEVREITSRAEANDYRMSSFLMGVLESEAFQMARMPDVVVEDAANGSR